MSQAQVLETKTQSIKVFHPCFESDMSGFYGGWHCCIGEYQLVEQYELPHYKRLVFLNALVPAHGILMCGGRVPVEVAKQVVQYFRNNNKPIESYIGHPATAQLLSSLFEVEIPANRAMYQPRCKDVAIIARLKRRLARPEDIKDIKPEDLEIWLYFYIE